MALRGSVKGGKNGCPDRSRKYRHLGDNKRSKLAICPERLAFIGDPLDFDLARRHPRGKIIKIAAEKGRVTLPFSDIRWQMSDIRR